MILDLTLNTDVLIRASADPDLEHGYESGEMTHSQDLLDAMRRAEEAKLVLDNERTIEQEYQDKTGAESFGRIFVRYMMQDDKIQWVDRAKGNMWRRVETPLRSTPLHREDRIFVRAAMLSNAKRIVAHEADFHHKTVRKVLKDKAGVAVDTAGEACTTIMGL